jgi:hypothetical protein
MERLLIPFFFAVVAVIAVAASATSRRHESQWRAAAEQLQLGYQAGRMLSRPKIAGDVGGLTVTIDVSSSSSGSSNSVRTRYRIGYPPLGLDLRMSRQTGFARAAALFGMSDTTIGDAEFDEAFSIRTSDPQRLAARLSSPTRRLLFDLVSEYKTLKITDEQLSYEKSGVERDAGNLTTTARRLIEAAQALQGASAQPTKRQPSTLPVRPSIPTPPPPPPVLSPDPFDPLAFDPIPRRSAPSSQEPDQPAPIAADIEASEVTAEEIANELFSKRGLSFQIAKRFEERYQGRNVSWPGEVRAISGGIGPDDPTRVTLLVATVRHELFGSVDVEATTTIRGRPPRGLSAGDPVTVQGTLTGIDAMSRRLVLALNKLDIRAS